MFDFKTQRIVRVIGHKNPDTDSICSAISYAYLKNQISDEPHEPRRAGDINKETEFVLKYFGMKKPRLSVDASPALGNIDIRLEPGIDGEMSLRDAWQHMVDRDIDTLCVTEPCEEDPENPLPEGEDTPQMLKGLITVKGIANANMALFDREILAKAETSYTNLIGVLQGKLLCGDPDAVIRKGRVGVGTSPEAMDGMIEEGDIYLVTNRYETQICAIENGCGCLILCMGATMSPSMLARAKEKGIAVISTELDTFSAARLITMAAPVAYYMKVKDLITFNINAPVEEARKAMSMTRHRYFPVVDSDGHYIGVVSRRNLMNLHRKKFILVDHNEQTQAVDGLDEADVLEIIDHHRIGNLETGMPVYFRNEPVGCTATIITSMFHENGVEIPKEIAGLLLSAILSDTLMFHSPTCTLIDRNAAKELAEIAGVDIETYGRQMFEAGEDLAGKNAEDILFTDFKEFALGDYHVSAGQGFYMSEKAFSEAETLVQEILPAIPARAGVDMVFYMITSVPKEGTLLLYAGEGAYDTVRRAFPEASGYVQKEDADEEAMAVADAPFSGSIWLPGIVSRKKQLIPPIRERLLEMRMM